MQNGFFSPGISLLNKYKYLTKISIISFLIILLITKMFLIINSEIEYEIKFAQKEKIGLEYIDGLKNLLQDVQQHRALATAYYYKKKLLEGSLSEKSEITLLNKKIDEDISLINKTQQKNNYALKMNKLWFQINDNWLKLKKNSLEYDPNENFKKHTFLINKIIYLISHISDVSNLVLDSDIENFYLARSISSNLPELTENTAQARGIGVGITARKKMIDDEKVFLIVKTTLIKDSLRRVNTNFLIIFDKNKIIKERLERFLDDINFSTNYFSNLMYREIINSKNIKISAKSYYSVATSSINSSFRFYEEEINTFNDLLTEVINKLEQKKIIIISCVIIVLLFTFYMFASFTFALLASLNTLNKTALSVSQGNLDARAEIFGKDEMGSLSVSFNNMIKDLKSLRERELILREIVISSLESRNINELLQNIVNKTGKIFKADKCFFVNYDSQHNEFLPINPNDIYISSLEYKNIEGKKFTKEEMEVYTNVAIKQKQVLVVNDVSKIIIPESTRSLMQELGIKSFMMAPLFYAGEPIGLLITDSVKKIKEYTEEEKNLIESIANESAVVINQAVLTEKYRETIKRETFLRKILNNILTSDNLEKALNLICEEVGKLFDAERVKIRIYNQAKNIFSEVISEYRKNEQIRSFLNTDAYNKEVSEYISSILVKKQEIIVEDIEHISVPDYMKKFCDIMSIKSFIDAPIFYEDELLATIIIENTTASKIWDKNNLDLLKPVCQQLALGINLFNLNSELKESLVNEKILRDIIIEARKFTDHDGIYNYLLNQLSSLFNPNRCLHLKHDEKNNLFVTNEVLNDGEIKPLLNQAFLSAEYTSELTPKELSEVSIVKDVNQEIFNPELKEYLISNKIQSYLLYFTTRILSKEKIEILGYTMICLPEPKIWSSVEINFYKFIIDSVSIIYLELKQRLETEEIKKTFMATLTHDLRSPILAEQIALEAMISKKINCSNEHYGEYLEDLYNTNKGLLKIVNNLLSVYHYESGLPVLNQQETNIKELMEESVRSLKYLATDKDSQISFDIQENLPLINVDRGEISRVFSNLVGNAIKHTKKGTQIKISAFVKDNFIQFAIQDNGEGISKEHINKIFQRYPVEKRKIGTGLGLYLSKQIIEAHKGEIWFETEEGVGTTFYFTLPV